MPYVTVYRAGPAQSLMKSCSAKHTASHTLTEMEMARACMQNVLWRTAQESQDWTQREEEEDRVAQRKHGEELWKRRWKHATSHEAPSQDRQQWGSLVEALYASCE